MSSSTYRLQVQSALADNSASATTLFSPLSRAHTHGGDARCHEHVVMGSVLGKVTEELPRHDVVKKAASGFYEIRRYAPAVVAETSYATKKGMFEGDQGGSFMRLAKYIGVMAKPQNDTTTAISMTAPVLMSHAAGKAADTPVGPSEGSEGESTYKMAFFMPASRFSKASDAPTPTNPNVTIKDVPSRTLAVHTFSGNLRQALITDRGEELRRALEADGVEAKRGAEVMAAGYNPPWTPWFLKTNEVMLEVTGM